MKHNSAYSDRDLSRAVNLSAILGWAAFSAPFVIGLGLGVLPIVAVIGLPIAFASCWIIGAPVLARLMRRPVTWARAAVAGAGISFAIAAISILISRIFGWMQSRNDSTSSQRGGGDYIQSVDGILTPYGWYQAGERTLMFMALGIVIALIVRKVIGAGNRAAP